MDSPNTVNNTSPKPSIISYSPILKAGFLAKRSNERRNWHKRWVELTASALLYYHCRKGNRVKGEIPLFNCTVEEQHNYEGKGRVVVLKTGGQKTYLLTAHNDAEMNSWIKSINKAIKNIELEKEMISPPTSPRGKETKTSKLQKAKKGFISSSKSPSKPRPPPSSSLPSPPSSSNDPPTSTDSGVVPSSLSGSGSMSPKKVEFNGDPSSLSSCSKDHLIELVHSLYFEHQKNVQNLHSLKQKSAEIVTSMKSQLLFSYSQNVQIKKELRMKDENILKMQRKINEAEQMVVEAIPFQDSLGRSRAQTLMKMMNDIAPEPEFPQLPSI